MFIHDGTPTKNKTVYLCYFLLYWNASENEKLMDIFAFLSPILINTLKYSLL